MGTIYVDLIRHWYKSVQMDAVLSCSCCCSYLQRNLWPCSWLCLLTFKWMVILSWGVFSLPYLMACLSEIGSQEYPDGPFRKNWKSNVQSLFSSVLWDNNVYKTSVLGVLALSERDECLVFRLLCSVQVGLKPTLCKMRIILYCNVVSHLLYSFKALLLHLTCFALCSDIAWCVSHYLYQLKFSSFV